jgi:CPA2 family monovalent cation:H+ antiporter-2
VQILVALAMGAGLALAWGWSTAAALVFGLSLSVASTVVLLRALEARGQLATGQGRIAVGWLVVEDLVMVLVLVLLPALAGLLQPAADASTAAGAAGLWSALGLTLAKVGAFIVLMLVVGRRLLPRALWWVARTGSAELFRLAVVAVAVGVAVGAAALFDVSFALGAFFAGMMLRESEFSHRAADESLPLRDAFAVLFFVSVGMLFDPAVLLQSPFKVLAVVAVIVLGKTLAAIALVLLLRHPLNTALTVGVSLAQIGEFSFILAGLGVALGLLPEEGRSLVLAGALLSIALNSALFAAIEPLQRWILARSGWARRLDAREDPLAALPASTGHDLLQGQVVVAGRGALAEAVADGLHAAAVALVVIDPQRQRVEALRAAGVAAVCGEPTDPLALVQAHIHRAGCLVLALDDAMAVGAITEQVRLLRPELPIIVGGTQGLADCPAPDPALHWLAAEAVLAEALVRQAQQLRVAPPAAAPTWPQAPAQPA